MSVSLSWFLWLTGKEENKENGSDDDEVDEEGDDDCAMDNDEGGGDEADSIRLPGLLMALIACEEKQ